MELLTVRRPELIPLFTGLSATAFERLVAAVAERGEDTIAEGRPGR